MTDVRLACIALREQYALQYEHLEKPALLVSYVYLDIFQAYQEQAHYRDWMLDSGAFSAFNTGTEIVLQDYIDKCKEVLAGPHPPSEVVALDVVGDWKASIHNAEVMWKQGIQAIPCYHLGEPWEALEHLAREYPKIGIGGMTQLKGRKRQDFASQCFARVWPKKVHGFGVGFQELILALPWHSVDASSWQLGPAVYGNWKAYGGKNPGLRGGKQNMRVEVDCYLQIEKLAKHRWRKEMALLETL